MTKAWSCIAAAAFAAVALAPSTARADDSPDATRLVTGKSITPLGDHTNVGSYPTSGILSPDGKYFLVSDCGAREYLSSISVADGSLVSQVDYNPAGFGRRRPDAGTTATAPSTPSAPNAAPTPAPAAPAQPGEGGGFRRGPRKSLYFGVACYASTSPSPFQGEGRGEVSGTTTVYASGGAGGLVSVLSLDASGKLTDTGKPLTVTDGARPVIAGLAVSSDGAALYAADNRADPAADMGGTLVIFDTASGAVKSRVALPGYPYAVAALTKGANVDKKVYVSSEQRGEVSVVDPSAGTVTGQIPTGTQPIGLLLDASQSHLYVANAGSDTVSVIDTSTDKVTSTILLRPTTARGIPGATPVAMALSPDESKLYVTLADMNAVAVVDVAAGTVSGYLPTGWYPTGIAVTPGGGALMIAEAKGVVVRNPNGAQKPGQIGRRAPLNIIEGVASRVSLANLDLAAQTEAVYRNNLDPIQPAAKPVNPGIKHVIYIIKENRTYDQILGDLTEGNGDSSICLFPQAVTPNLHALAQRFVLLDNFYCCAEVSGDGWNWSTAGIASEYVSRNVPYSYGGRGRTYDYEGTNNGVPVDLKGIPDAAEPPGGYIWDDCAAHNISQRDYGFFTYDIEPPRTDAQVSAPGTAPPRSEAGEQLNMATKSALTNVSDHDFRDFDLSYHDSDAWVQDKLTLGSQEKSKFGAFDEPSRYSEWKREFDGYVKNGKLPQFTMLRLMCDHTGGTRGGGPTPRSQVADNDYAVGEVVEAVSKSPYWKSSLIVVVEDDAQSGYDHVDCHRSIAFAISPFIKRASHDSRFYNTDSALRTIEVMLGLPPMTQYDAIAAPFDDFTSKPDNAEPYTAILPDKSIIGEYNDGDDFGAAWSKKNIDLTDERSEPDEELNEVLWRSIKHSDPPPIRHSVQFGPSTVDQD